MPPASETNDRGDDDRKGCQSYYSITKPYGGQKGFMESYGLKYWNDDDIQESKAIMDAIREHDASDVGSEGYSEPDEVGEFEKFVEPVQVDDLEELEKQFVEFQGNTEHEASGTYEERDDDVGGGACAGDGGGYEDAEYDGAGYQDAGGDYYASGYDDEGVGYDECGEYEEFDDYGEDGGFEECGEYD